MSAVSAINTTFVSRRCPCDWAKIAKNTDSILPWVGIAVAIIGVAAMIFSSLWAEAVGFGICGLVLLRSLCTVDAKAIGELKEQIEKSDQLLTVKQGEITSITKELADLRGSTKKAQREFDKQLEQYKGANQSLKKLVKELPKEAPKLAKKNEKLSQTVTALTKQVEESKAAAQAFERQIQDFITQHQKVVPQLDQLSEAARSLEGSELRVRGAMSGFNHELTQGLTDFSLRLQAWQLTTEQMLLQNKTLSTEVNKLKSAVSTEEETARRIERASETFRKENETKKEYLTRLTQLRDELIAVEARIAEQRKLLDAGVQQTEALIAGKQRKKSSGTLSTLGTPEMAPMRRLASNTSQASGKSPPLEYQSVVHRRVSSRSTFPVLLDPIPDLGEFKFQPPLASQKVASKPASPVVSDT